MILTTGILGRCNNNPGIANLLYVVKFCLIHLSRCLGLCAVGDGDDTFRTYSQSVIMKVGRTYVGVSKMYLDVIPPYPEKPP
jgi:hypothetical protein